MTSSDSFFDSLILVAVRLFPLDTIFPSKSLTENDFSNLSSLV